MEDYALVELGVVGALQVFVHFAEEVVVPAYYGACGGDVGCAVCSYGVAANDELALVLTARSEDEEEQGKRAMRVFIGSWFLVLGFWFLVLGSWFWFLVFGSWFLVMD